MEQGEHKLTLIEKMFNVMSELDYIQKDKRNTFHNYTYASEAAIKNSVHAALVKWRVMFIPYEAKILSLQQGFGAKQDEALSTISLEYKFVDVDNPSDVVLGSFTGTGADKGDKGTYKAITGALKYALTSTFLIETGDDPEKEGSLDVPVEQKKDFQQQDRKIAQQGLEALQRSQAAKIQAIRQEPVKFEIPKPVQDILDRAGDNKEKLLQAVNDLAFEIAGVLPPKEISALTESVKSKAGGCELPDMNLNQLKNSIYFIWKAMNDAPKPAEKTNASAGMTVASEVLENIGVGPDSPLWVSKPHEAVKDSAARSAYMDYDKGKRGKK
jgi:hypothetical protein